MFKEKSYLKSFLLLASLLPFYAAAFNDKTASPNDTIYYLIDTAKIIGTHTMEIDTDHPFKYFTLQNRCLLHGGEPAMSYSLKDIGKVIDKKEMQALNLVTASTFISKVKVFLGYNYSGRYVVFVIEPKGKKFIMHQVRLFSADKDPGLTDYENIPAPDSTKKQ